MNIRNRFVTECPSHQHAIDLVGVETWNCAFPDRFKLTAGQVKTYDDARIHWCLEQLGGTAGMKILELGPLEASHTYMLANSRFGKPASIIAVEANSLAFIKCLIAKNLLHIDCAEFILGDFTKFLDGSDEDFDFVLASGVLYHMPDPIGLLEKISRRTNRLLLWTHYYDAGIFEPQIGTKASPFSGKTKPYELRGHVIAMHERSYLDAMDLHHFCGGTEDKHYWLERADILKILQLLGFQDIRTSLETRTHVHGPALSIYASK